MRVKGSWPGEVGLRSGWGRATARPWNEASDDAALRLVRGSAGFLAECAAWLCEAGAARVLTPPLDVSSQRVWRAAGFEPAIDLDVFVRDLLRPTPEPDGEVVVGDADDWQAAVTVDDAAFDEDWRMGPLGLAEARRSTPRSVFLTTHEGGRLTGFVIVGAAVSTGYLQRLAVDPEDRGRGFGRDLVRAACRWAAGQGATRIVLNTQPDNVAAAALYDSEGFTASRGSLAVLARAC